MTARVRGVSSGDDDDDDDDDGATGSLSHEGKPAAYLLTARDVKN
jgi:hypothetical protein